MRILKWKRNEYRKSYYYNIGRICFEGNFKDGIRNGKGIDYYLNRNIEFEGEYLNGYKYNVKGYDLDCNFAYELKNGCGYVKTYNNFYNRLSYEGEYKESMKNGKGKEYNSDGKLIFEGDYKNDKKWNGFFFNEQNVYELKEGNDL